MRIGNINIKFFLQIEISKYCRYLTILLVIFLSKQSAYSQFIYYDQSDSTDWSMVDQMVESGRGVRDSLQDLGYTAEMFFIHEVVGNWWMTIDGRFDVFEWQEGKWINLYNGTYHGYNYKSQKFIYKGKLFSYKGYGFWREHGEIIEFLPDKSGWEIIPDSKNIPYGIGYIIDSLFYIHSNNCYEVSLQKQRVKSVPCIYSIREQIPHGREYVFDDYVMIASRLDDGTQFPLIEKNTGNVYLSHRQPFKGIRDPRTTNALIHIKGNQLTILFPDSSSIQYNVEDELKYYLQEPNEAGLAMSRYWWVLIGVSILFFGTIILRSFKKPTVQSEVTRLTPFKDYSGRLIDSDELDKILGIDEITVYETRKHKRASLIRELNSLSKYEYGHELILREKNPEDKRFYLYRIQSLDNS